MPLAARITLQPSARPVGGLLAASRPIVGEWWRGVTFSSVQCTAPQAIGSCDNVTPKETQRPSEPQEFQSFGIVQAIECSTLGGTDVKSLADQSLDVTREFAAGLEFLAAGASGNPSLADASVYTADDTVSFRRRLACLDQLAAETLSGRLAFIHVPPALLDVYFEAGLVYRDGVLWRTAYGSIVVASPGYDGRAPEGLVDPGDNYYVYATGEVYAATGERDTNSSVDRSVNTAQAWSEEAAIVVFDPCFVAALDSGVAACDLILSS